MYNEENENKSKESSSGEYSPNSYSAASCSASSCTASYRKVFVLSAGGSILVTEKPKTTFIAKFSETINELMNEGFGFCIVVGGGKIARSYVAAAKTFGADNFSLDELGIQASRLNAMLLIQTLEKAHPSVQTDVNKAEEILAAGKIPVFGGLIPGFTTDTVAALLAEKLHCDFINLTNVDGIYSADPEHNPRAKFFPEIGYEKLLSLIRLSESKPAQNVILDLPCCMILKRSKIQGIVLDGNDLANFKAALRGEDFKGTVISEKETA